MEIEMDFYQDVVEICRTALRQFGFKKVGRLSDTEAIRALDNLQLKIPAPKPRTIRMSVELLHRLTNPHSSLREDHKEGVVRLIKAMVSGVSLRPWLSTGVQKHAHDGLLYQWGVHHFHLGRDQSYHHADKWWVARTGPLVFAHITNQYVYLIDIYEHGDWYATDIFEKAFKNWPNIYRNHRLNGINSPKRERTRESVEKYRKLNINTPIIDLQGAVYISPAGGVTSDGSTVTSLMFRDKLRDCIRLLESHIRQEAKKLTQAVRQARGELPDRVVLKFERDIQQTWWCAYDHKHKIRVGFSEFSIAERQNDEDVQRFHSTMKRMFYLCEDQLLNA